MKYFVKYLLKAEYTLGDKLTIRSGEEKEVSKEIFDYLNSTYGDSGWFTFRKDQAVKKAAPKKQAEVKAEAEADEVAPKSTRKSKTVK